MGTKFFTYDGKQCGFIRKMVDDVILIEDAWINEMKGHCATNGYDTLLELVARVLSAKGHPAISRAQAFIVLQQFFKGEVPEVLQNTEIDEVKGKGNLFAKPAKAAAAAVNTVTKPVGKVVGGGINAVSGVLKKTSSKNQSSEVTEDGSK